MIIREITIADIPDILEMGRLMHEESAAYRDLEYNPEKCAASCVDIIDHPEYSIGIIAVNNDTMQTYGMLWAYVDAPIFSTDLVVMDCLVFVHPAHRGGTAFIRLIHYMEKWAAEKKACLITMATSTEVNTERTDKAFQQLGYKSVGSVFRKEIKTCV